MSTPLEANEFIPENESDRSGAQDGQQEDDIVDQNWLAGWFKTAGKKVKGAWQKITKSFDKQELPPLRVIPLDPHPEHRTAAPVPPPVQAQTQPAAATEPARPIYAAAISNLLRSKLQTYDNNLTALDEELNRMQPFYKGHSRQETGLKKLSVNPFVVGTVAAFSEQAETSAVAFELSAEISPLSVKGTTAHYRVNYGVPATLQVTDCLGFHHLKWFYGNPKYLQAYTKLKAKGIALYADRRMNRLITGDGVSERFHRWSKNFLKQFGH